LGVRRHAHAQTQSPRVEVRRLWQVAHEQHHMTEGGHHATARYLLLAYFTAPTLDTADQCQLSKHTTDQRRTRDQTGWLCHKSPLAIVLPSIHLVATQGTQASRPATQVTAASNKRVDLGGRFGHHSIKATCHTSARTRISAKHYGHYFLTFVLSAQPR
jgi:hypothetical protein